MRECIWKHFGPYYPNKTINKKLYFTWQNNIGRSWYIQLLVMEMDDNNLFGKQYVIMMVKVKQ